MILLTRRLLAGAILTAPLFCMPLANALLGNLLNQGKDSGAAGGLGSLGGLGNGHCLDSLTSSSAGNVAGVIEYCVKNNYLGGGAVRSRTG
jgi:hypothetical protein